MVQMLVGPGVSYSNVIYNGTDISRGSFANGNNIGISNGIVLSTGNVNTIANDPSVFVGFSNGGVINDPDLNLVCNAFETHSGSILEFDFIPNGNLVTFKYVFASDEYPINAPPCYTPFNDGFGFFISGPGLSGPYLMNTAPNIAIIPFTSIPISINNVNCFLNSSYYVPNYNGDGGCIGCGNGAIITAPDFAFGGYTTILEATVQVIPNVTYHIKLGVANAMDEGVQSAIFLKEGSFTTNTFNINTVYAIPELDTTTVEGCNSAIISIILDSIATSPVNVALTYSGTANYGIDYPALPNNLVIATGNQTASLLVTPISDGLSEGSETIGITSSITTIYGTQSELTTLLINDYPPLIAQAPNDLTIFSGTSVNLSATHTGGIVPFHFLWNTGDTTAIIPVSPGITTTYSVQITDGCGSISSDNVIVTVLPPSTPTIVGSNDTTIYQGNPAVLNAQLTGGSYGTSNYTFEQYPYSPESYVGGTQIQFQFVDDDVKGPFPIGFDFCFFNQYSVKKLDKCLIFSKISKNKFG
jgi:hypothetical protein